MVELGFDNLFLQIRKLLGLGPDIRDSGSGTWDLEPRFLFTNWVWPSSLRLSIFCEKYPFFLANNIQYMTVGGSQETPLVLSLLNTDHKDYK